MFIQSTSIDLFDQNMDMECAKVRLSQMSLPITEIDLCDQHLGMVCAKVRLRC